MKKKREVQISIIRSRRKTLALQIDRDGNVLVRAPYWVPDDQIARFVNQKKDWIRLQLDKLANTSVPDEDLNISKEELEQLKQQALKVIPERVAFFAPKVGVTYGRITIRKQRTRWGSCSEKGNLNFNCLLMKVPDTVRDYVVVHELCHRKEMNHSERFWEQVRHVLPDYKESEKWLHTYGKALIRSAHTG